MLALLVEKMAQLEASDGLVLVVQFDGTNLVHLPPLYPHRQKKSHLVTTLVVIMDFFHILFSILQKLVYYSLTYRFSKAEKAFGFSCNNA